MDKNSAKGGGPSRRWLCCLVVAALVTSSIVPATAAAVPGADDLPDKGEVPECAGWEEAANPLSDVNASEYANCQIEQFEQKQRNHVISTFEDRLRQYQAIESWVSRTVPLL